MKKITKHLFVVLLLLPLWMHAQKVNSNGALHRDYFVNAMVRIADPLLTALSKNELKKKMPVEAKTSDRQNFTYLEAFGRLLAGMAPWLELGPDSTTEGKLRKKYLDLSITCIRNATDPAAPDYMNFNKGGQALVDAAFLSQALLRAPNQLWGRLDAKTRKNLLEALKSSRVITPGHSNWLFFSAMIEAALLQFEGSCDKMRVDYAVSQHLQWYKGDGAYGDGATFHWDYYNSFVIQPMFLEVLQILINSGQNENKTYELELNRARRYAAIQERMISPEGTYPPIGRSLAYRFGAFQLLSKIALMHQLPNDVLPQQVRCAFYEVVKRQLEAPHTFDSAGWLTIGLAGHQPGVGEPYISTGSLYLCSQVFLVLGLPATDAFWQNADADWTAKKAWQGEAIPIDHAIEN
ncbi:hypothetical protein A4H97_00460 [Niastella yeongjuensis]|uniref:DUF2264 domain-containing protein n=1 Tax=Niastella yeongjuensis TaxID=354355 RepID=A0A1V9EW34_9BACT|nr:DUF2264 domain-containing protein [Niastella yeongjuensis]OQP50350.1 hypothetical protein A4H97_00460 [Niastella yeongjuensis]SEN38242.1 hypothetical protein SAMN05660816_00857 [Niastella yeongjuensis]